MFGKPGRKQNVVNVSNSNQFIEFDQRIRTFHSPCSDPTFLPPILCNGGCDDHLVLHFCVVHSFFSGLHGCIWLACRAALGVGAPLSSVWAAAFLCKGSCVSLTLTEFSAHADSLPVWTKATMTNISTGIVCGGRLHSCSPQQVKVQRTWVHADKYIKYIYIYEEGAGQIAEKTNCTLIERGQCFFPV